MDNLGDWLYIVFLIVFALSGLFSSGKKKKKPVAKPVQPQQQSNSPQNTSKEKGFWEILEEMQNGPQEEKPRAKKTPLAKPVISKKVAAAAPSPFLTAEKDIQNSQALQQNPILFEEAHNEPQSISSEDIHLSDIAEIRKAIIYSEILNRKYQ